MQEANHDKILNKDMKPDPNTHCNTKLDDYLTSIAKNEGYVSYNINKKAISADGGNYLGVLYDINIKGKTADGDKENALFVKTMNLDAIDVEIVSLPSVFKTELFIYKEIMKIYNDLQDEANVPCEERLNVVKCYEESYDEALIFDNMTKKGFKTWFRMDVVTLEIAEKCIEQLAKFHGMSHVVEQKKPDFFNKKIKSTKPAWAFGEVYTSFAEKYSNFALQFLNENLRNKIEKKIQYMFTKCEKYHKGDTKGYCLCHGDYRINNILIKETNGIVTECLPIDYQLTYYGCPILDFYYFMYSATDYQFRQAHMLHLKNLYYSSFEKFLQYFDICAETVLPRKVFENFFEERRDFGLMTTLTHLPFMYISEDHEAPDITTQSVLELELNIDDRYKDMLQGTIKEFIELDYF